MFAGFHKCKTHYFFGIYYCLSMMAGESQWLRATLCLSQSSMKIIRFGRWEVESLRISIQQLLQTEKRFNDTRFSQ